MTHGEPDASTASLDISLLRTFLAVHRAGSFTAAARLLGLSQPTVTTQMRSLEEQLGRELFERQPRGVLPTSVADGLAAEVAAPLDALAAVADRRGAGADQPPDPVQLAGPAELLCTRVLPALAPLTAQGVRLRVTPGLTDDLLDGLRGGRPALLAACVRRTADRPGLDHGARPAGRAGRGGRGRGDQRAPPLSVPGRTGLRRPGASAVPRGTPINTGYLTQRPGASDNPHVAVVRERLLQAGRTW